MMGKLYKKGIRLASPEMLLNLQITKRQNLPPDIRNSLRHYFCQEIKLPASNDEFYKKSEDHVK